MGTRTLTTFQAELQGAVQRTITDTAQMTRWLNDSVREFAYAFKFPELESSVSFNTVDGTYEYAIGSGLAVDIANFRALHELGLRKMSPLERKGRLIPETREQFLLRTDLTESTSRGDPMYYHRFRRSIFLRPVPDSTVVAVLAHVWLSVTPMSLPASTTQFHEDWDEIVLLGAMYRAFRHYGEHNQYINIRNDFLGMIRSRVMELDLEQFPEGGINPITGPDASESDLVSG